MVRTFNLSYVIRYMYLLLTITYILLPPLSETSYHVHHDNTPYHPIFNLNLKNWQKQFKTQ